jgi:transcription elongation factor SPT5
MVKCKEGCEANILIALMNKFVVKANEGDPLAIMSASSTVPGTIFIEAYRDAQVKAAVSGIADLWGFRPGSIVLVPIPQMTAALKVVTIRDAFRTGDLVRVSRGEYKGDIAQVVRSASGEMAGRLLIRLVPRIDLVALSAVTTKGFRGRRSAAAGGRPPQRLYDRAELEEALGASGRAAIENRLKYGMRLDFFGSKFFSPASCVCGAASSRRTRRRVERVWWCER